MVMQIIFAVAAAAECAMAILFSLSSQPVEDVIAAQAASAFLAVLFFRMSFMRYDP